MQYSTVKRVTFRKINTARMNKNFHIKWKVSLMKKVNYFSVSSLWSFCRWRRNSSSPAVCAWHRAAAAVMKFLYCGTVTVKVLHESTANCSSPSDASWHLARSDSTNLLVWLLWLGGTCEVKRTVQHSSASPALTAMYITLHITFTDIKARCNFCFLNM